MVRFIGWSLSLSKGEKRVYTPSKENPASARVKIAIVDCGVKTNVIRCFLARNAEVTVVPCNDNLEGIDSQAGTYPAALQRAEPATIFKNTGMDTHKIHTLQNDDTPLLCGGVRH